jgi:hypothetical protein
LQNFEAPDALLAGAIDLHVHGYPDMGFQHHARVDDPTMVALARDYGLRGVVLKSHFWPTMDRAYLLNDRLRSDTFTVFGSITLNHVAGSISPMSVEAAAAHGAKLVYLPTWGSCHDHEQGGTVRQRVIEPNFPSIPRTLDARGALAVLDDDGLLLPEVHDIIEICKAKGMVLCTGHISPRESLAVFRAAHAAGLERLIATHPFSNAIGTSLEQGDELVRLGAVLEFTFANTVSANSPMGIRRVAELVRRYGAANCVLSTDVFFEYLPPQPETLRMFAHQLVFAGIAEADVRTMMVTNPSRLLGLAA